MGDFKGNVNIPPQVPQIISLPGGENISFANDIEEPTGGIEKTWHRKKFGCPNGPDRLLLVLIPGNLVTLARDHAPHFFSQSWIPLEF